MADLSSHAARIASDHAASETPRKSEGWPDTPWVAVDDTPYVCPFGNLGKIIAMVIGRSDDGQEVERDAIKNLIAAAPDLYDALDALMASIDVSDPEQWHCSTVAYADAQTALSRARGEAQ